MSVEGRKVGNDAPGNDASSVSVEGQKVRNDAPRNNASSRSVEGQEEKRARKRARVYSEGKDQGLDDQVRRTKIKVLERRKRQEALASLMGVPVHPRARVPSAGLRTRAREHFVKRQLGMGMQPHGLFYLPLKVKERIGLGKSARKSKNDVGLTSDSPSGH